MPSSISSHAFEQSYPALPEKYHLQNYEIEHKLGKGAFGINYLAKEYMTDFLVVIKENFPEYCADRDISTGELRPKPGKQDDFQWALESFEKEARTLRKLPKHPNFVHIIGVFPALNTAYIVMERIEGENLFNLYPAGTKMEPELLKSILHKLLEALEQLHKSGIIHRDIKPANIMLTPEGEPVIIDFGAARPMEGTRLATQIGTPEYAPPEQLINTQYAENATQITPQPHWDLYALGCTCHQLITGYIPITGTRPLRERPELLNDYSLNLLESIDKAHEKEPADRWQSVQNWLEAISPAPTNGTRMPTIAEPTPLPAPKISKEVAQAELQRRGISAEEYDSKLHDAAKDGDAELVKLLIDAGADVNKANEKGETPLYWAAANGRTECVKLLIDAGADVNKADKDGRTPLILAAYYGHAECVKLLINAGADVNMANEDGLTPLYPAAWNGHTECVKLLIAAGADVNKADEKGETPLYFAAFYGRKECMKLLIDAGADVNKAEKDGLAPLYWAAEEGHTECVKQLLAAGADVNKANEKGETPLFWAAYEGHTDCVKLLIAAGADVNKADEKGETPLYCAAYKGHTECVKLLIAAGADVNKANEKGETPLYKAEEGGHTECAKLLRAAGNTHVPTIEEPAPTPKITQQAAQAELRLKGITAAEYDSKLLEAAENGKTEQVKLLVAAGADVNKADNDWDRTPLYRAASEGHTECVKLLIAAGADVNKADKFGSTPLYRAAYYGHTECVKLLIAAGADVNKASHYGETPLYRAAYNGHTECVKLLIVAGADVNMANKYGRTPLYWAAYIGHTECVKLLIDAGADVNKADEFGETPLYEAAYYGYTECMKLLIDAGADVNKVDKEGETPLYWATLNGHTECAELLLAAGNTGGMGGFSKRFFS